MHGFELQRHIEHFFDQHEQFQTFLTVLSELAGHADGMTPFLERITKGGQHQNDGAAYLHSHLTAVHQATSGMSQRQFFKALDQFQVALSQLYPTQFVQAGLVADIIQQVEDFSVIYDTFITRGSAANALPVILAARALYSRIQILMQSVELFDALTGNHDIAGNAEEPLTIWLPAHFDLGSFARRLLAMQTLYSELCMLFSISESDHPLRISKIESGSLWAKFFGESRIIGLITTFIKEAAKWMYRHQTSEGKISSVAMKIDAVDAMLGLNARLKAAGLDTVGMEKHIEKSAFIISRDLSTLLDGQSSVTVNSVEISAVTEHHRQLLEPSARPQLANPSITAPTTDFPIDQN